MTDDKNEMVKTALSGGQEDVTLRFMVYGNLDGRAKHWMAIMRRQYAELAREITVRVPPSRERSVALTKLEEASRWTTAAIARLCGEPAGYGDELQPPDELNATGHHHG